MKNNETYSATFKIGLKKLEEHAAGLKKMGRCHLQVCAAEVERVF
jgi:hypothetical protein